jgi:Protein of unknown function (DUF2721)
MDAVGGNPFAVLTAVVAPAILTNASSVLALGTSNRMARVVDRTRVVAKELAALEPGDPQFGSWVTQLEHLQYRVQLLVKALRVIYASLGLFAASALLSLIGGIMSSYGSRVWFDVTAALALLSGAAAVVGLASGCALMVHETRYAVRALADEAKVQGSNRRVGFHA